MRFGGAAFAVEPTVPRYHLIAGANFRAGPSRDSTSLGVIPKGTIAPVAYWVDGESIGADDQWAIVFLYVGGAYVNGYFHRSVLGAPQQQPAAADCSSAVKAATAPLAAELTALNTRIAAARKALG